MGRCSLPYPAAADKERRLEKLSESLNYTLPHEAHTSRTHTRFAATVCSCVIDWITFSFVYESTKLPQSESITDLLDQ